jgi:hypothetical protein
MNANKANRRLMYDIESGLAPVLARGRAIASTNPRKAPRTLNLLGIFIPPF